MFRCHKEAVVIIEAFFHYQSRRSAFRRNYISCRPVINYSHKQVSILEGVLALMRRSTLHLGKHSERTRGKVDPSPANRPNLAPIAMIVDTFLSANERKVSHDFRCKRADQPLFHRRLSKFYNYVVRKNEDTIKA
jgi:hypothetical protein